MMKYFIIILILFACKKPTSGGGSVGGSVPTAQDLNDYIDRITTPDTKTCADSTIDLPKIIKHPIIYPSGKYQWKKEYSESISDQFDKDYMTPLRNQKIDEGDLSLLGCTGYNYATDAEKKQFWILFLSAVSKPESNFDVNNEYGERNGTVSTGLLQIDAQASNDWCGVLSSEMKKGRFGTSDMHNPKTNLQCGLIMIQKQLSGVKTEPRGKFYKDKLFTSGPDYWYWSTLADKNSAGKKEVIDWFRVHAQRQLRFCNRANPIDGYTPGLSSRYKKMNCNEVQNNYEKQNCIKYLQNLKIEEDMFNPSLGEVPTNDKCDEVNNLTRHARKELFLNEVDLGTGNNKAAHK